MLRIRVQAVWVGVVAVLMVGTAASAQDVPFMGVVTQDDVKVRAGAGRAYYVVGELDKGAVVQVDEVIFGWNKIVPPEGVYSYIAEGHVERRGDGETGVVSADRVEVKAGSVKGPGESYRGQVVLNRGDRVEILGYEGNFYKIAPPKDAYVFLPPGSVNRASAEQIAAARGETTAEEPPADPVAQAPEQPVEPPADQAPQVTPPPTSAVTADPVPAQPGTPGSQQVEAPVEPTTQTAEATEASVPTITMGDPGTQAATPGATEPEQQATAAATQPEAARPATADAVMNKDAASVQTAAVSEKLRALEQRLIPQFFKPLEQQPIDEMIREYQAIAREPLPPVDRQIVRMRLAALQRNREIAQTLNTIQSAQADPVEVTIPQSEPGAPLRYDAVGQLLASSVYNGQSLPRMFRVVDPATGRTIVWVEPGGPVEARQYLGKVVGVIGTQEYDPALKFNVLDVQRIDVLEAQPNTTTQ